MRPTLSFFVTGLPKAQPRTKARACGKFAQVYTPSTANDWKMIVRNEARRAWEASGNATAWTGPLRVDLTFLFPRPKGHYKSQSVAASLAGAPRLLKPLAPLWHTAKPDRDNSDKAILDALTNLGVWLDDKQVCDGRIQKRYVKAGETPGCHICIQEAEGETLAPLSSLDLTGGTGCKVSLPTHQPPLANLHD